MTRPYRSLLREQHKPTAHRMRRAGHSNAAIAMRLGIARQTILEWLGPQPRRVIVPEPLPELSWETAGHANAAAIAAWVDKRIAPERIAACGVGSIMSSWREGGTTSFWTVDRVMTKLGLHVAQLPDEVWCRYRSMAA